MTFNVGDRFVEFLGGESEGVSYTVTKVLPNGDFYAKSDKWGHFFDGGDFFVHNSPGDHLVAPCADCEGVCLTFYATESVYKCEECGNDWD